MRRAARTDGNHAEVRDGLRAMGWSVFDTSALGAGFPDLVVGARGLNVLLELKDESQPPSRRRLTKAETKFFMSWRGQIDVVESLDEAIAAVKQRLEVR